MKKKQFFFILLTIFLAACDNSYLTLPDAQTSLVPNSNEVSIQEALCNADLLFSKVYGDSTRSSQRIPVSVEKMHRGTRSLQTNDEIQGFYLVNYADDNGFAILSADRRLEPVYAISDIGQVHLSDTIDNKGLSWYFNQALPQMAVQSLTLPTLPDPVGPVIQNDLCVTIQKPLLNRVMTAFSQHSPYNQYCPLKDNSRTLVGCAPLAAGTIMGYYEFPEVINGRTMNWKEMKENSEDSAWGWLFATLGDKNHMMSDYGVSSTSTISAYIWYGFSPEGYKSAGCYTFSESLLTNELENSRPAYLLGYFYDDKNDEYGHAWIIDGGYKRVHRYPAEALYPGSDQVVKTTYYFHCVWGWEGKGNGYYLYNDSLGGKPTTQTGNENGDADAGYVFTKLYLYTELEPNI